MNPLEMVYEGVVRAARAASPLAARGDSKLARGLRGRQGAASRLRSWGMARRDPTRPLVWLHAPSVGEGLQARAVLEALRRLRPGLQAVFTHFSPSAEGLAGRMPADVADYLPWDTGRQLGPVLDAVRPDLVAFTKTEVWPGLTRQAARRGIPTALVAATLPEGSSRLGAPARLLLGPAFRRLAAVLAIADDDARRFGRLGVDPERVAVTGDPGVDSAAERAAAADPESPWLAPFHRDPRTTVVAGSTWPPDEAVLLPALDLLRRERPGVRVVVAPHEPARERVEELVAALRDGGRWTTTLAEVEGSGSASGVDAVVVERVGVLAELYTVGSAAYVGGGFGDDGLHSVLEPAAAGVPVAFGPRHGNARAAGEIVEAGGARVVAGATELGELLVRWTGDGEERASAARGALGYIRGHRGAADRTAAALADLVDARRRGRAPGAPRIS